MIKYGQYCPVAQALEIIGDRWTLLIIRDMLTGTRHFNELQRGLPGISRGLLAKRLRQLQAAGIVGKVTHESGRNTTEYVLTKSGEALQDVIRPLMIWGANWAFEDPSPEQLDPLLLMWWLRNRVRVGYLPEGRTVVQFKFYGDRRDTYWLVLQTHDVSVCLTDPGYEIGVFVKSDLATFFKIWLGRIEYHDAVRGPLVDVEGIPAMVRAFPSWFAWSPAADAVRSAQQRR